MHLNYYFLRRLSAVLSRRLEGFKIVEVFSQNKDELILSFLNGRAEFHIKAVLGTKFTALTFPDEFARARRNSVDLFTELQDLNVVRVRQFANERSFSIVFEKSYELLFKMHGKRSNVILYQDGSQISMFNSQMKFDLGLELDSLERRIDQTKIEFAKKGLNIFPTFDQTIRNRLSVYGFYEDTSDQWAIIQEVLSQVNKSITVYQPSADHPPELTLFPIENEQAFIHLVTNDPIEACNSYFRCYTKTYFLKDERNHVLRAIRKKIKKTEGYIKKTSAKLEEIELHSRHNELADILMANIHNVPKNATEVTLYDFYKDQDVRIKLKRDLSAQKNAEYLYRKAKNQKLETDKLYENILSKEDLKESLQEHLVSIEELDSVKELRKYAKIHSLLHTREETEEQNAFKKVQFGNWQIWIGRNSKNNDELTQKHARKDDLWLHAKDVSGSHVVIKQIAGREFPMEIIEKAAQLAAWYSKRKNDTICPVQYTPRKYVRKPKGMLPGQVIVDREKVILVEPASIEKLTSDEQA